MRNSTDGATADLTCHICNPPKTFASEAALAAHLRTGHLR